MLFIFSLNGFSHQLKEAGADKLKGWLTKATSNRVKGFLTGLTITAVIQSSSAMSSIVVALIDSEVLIFSQSLPVLIGANVGSTFTAWLVAFKIQNLGAILIVVGSLVSIIPLHIKLAGKSIFYLGLILFSLELLGANLEVLSKADNLKNYLIYADNLIIGMAVGALLTAVLQSSSVVTGLVIMLSQQDVITLYAAIAVIIGSNLGTTSTALIVSLKLSSTARKAAQANFWFNLIGIVLFIPFLSLFVRYISQLSLELSYQIAVAHLIFNLTTAILVLIFYDFFLYRLVPDMKTTEIEMDSRD